MTAKIALVTGAGSGIGRAVALGLAKAGYTVVLAGRRLTQLERVAQEAAAGAGIDAGVAAGPGAIADAGAVTNAGVVTDARAVGIVADVTDPASVDALFARIEKDFGRLDLLFNNAGVSAPPAPLEDLPLQQWRSVVDTNLTGAFLCTQAAFRLMKSQQPRGGRIINNGSVSATAPRPHLIAYTASKHAVTGLTKATSLEGRQYDIACGQIDIGNTATELAAAMKHGTLQADLSIKTEPTFDVKYVVDAVVYMAGLPLEANVLFMTVMATKMPFVGRG